MYSHYGDTFMAFILHRIYTLDSAPQQWQSAAYSASAQNFSPGWEKILRQSPLSFQPVRHTTQSVYLRMPIICTQPVSAAEITDEACASIITSRIYFSQTHCISFFLQMQPFISFSSIFLLSLFQTFIAKNIIGFRFCNLFTTIF